MFMCMCVCEVAIARDMIKSARCCYAILISSSNNKILFQLGGLATLNDTI